MMNKKEALESFGRLLDIMDQLREKCPWDKKQTIESLRNMTIEETFELAQAILEDNKTEIKKELGDILLHIVFYSKIGDELGVFNIKTVIDSLCEKLIYRHPHVFGEGSAANSDEVKEKWEELKLKEKGGNKTVLSGVPDALPAMIKANRIQSKVRAVGFDWDEKTQVWDKVKEEIQELEHEITHQNKDKIESEFGDVFFSLINAARLYDIDPEIALDKTNRKFKKRFAYLENKTIAQGKSLKEMSLEEMDIYWNEAKKIDNQN